MKNQVVNRNALDLNAVDLNANKAWVTFMHENWGQVWFAVRDAQGNHLDWSDDIMDICREKFNDFGITFGVSNTEQMIFGNAMRDNI